MAYICAQRKLSSGRRCWKGNCPGYERELTLPKLSGIDYPGLDLLAVPASNMKDAFQLFETHLKKQDMAALRHWIATPSSLRF